MGHLESPAGDLFDGERSTAKSLEIALLLEQLCLCSLADDEAGVANYSALLQDALTERSRTFN